ncbi:DUF3850 domain-containing protein [Pontibacter beigongshangensis]|uniref:DUF3850 domain-containing protein n=1 Tax=Pontibacter beigongshangensis TaxID=2574733 RepID=UPI00164F4AF9|nr:DUF3850 domain-containing protein [Pontibacter beigongshangensis]
MNLTISSKLTRYLFLKIWPEFYEPVKSGVKPFDLRLNDRNYKPGDVVQFEEYCPKMKCYTDRRFMKKVTYVLENWPGLEENFCILGLRDIDRGGGV